MEFLASLILANWQQHAEVGNIKLLSPNAMESMEGSI